MKEYFFQKHSNFINGGFKELRLFDFVNTFNLYNYLIAQEENLKNISQPEYYTTYSTVEVEQNWMRKYNQTRQLCTLRVKTDCTASFTSKFTYSIFNDKPSTIESVIFREDTIRSIYSPSVYLYLTIPHAFLLENLKTNLDYTDLQIFYSEFKQINLNSFKSIVNTVSELDFKYPDKTVIPGQSVPKTDDYFKWRSGILLNMLYTVYKVGFGYPLINTSTSCMFFDGTHRLSICPVVKKDYPVLLRIPIEETNNIFYYITPNVFVDNKCGLFIIDILTRKVQVKLLSLEETYPFTKVQNYNQTIKNIEIKDYVELIKIVDKLEESNLDCIWYEQ